MSAEEFAVSFGNYAAANDIIMVLPQAINCFMGDVEGDEDAAWNQVARNGSMMQFMKGIFDQAISGSDNLEAELATGAYEYNTAYPECTWNCDEDDEEYLQLASIPEPTQAQEAPKGDNRFAYAFGILGVLALAGVGYKKKTQKGEDDFEKI